MKTPIVFAINESYYKQLETVIVSILENSQSNFEFIVLSKGLPEFCKDANKLIRRSQFGKIYRFVES